VRVIQADTESRSVLHGLLLSRYLDGECYEIAIGLHRATGLPMVGLWDPEASGDDGLPGTWRHAALRLPDGNLFDARGIVPLARFTEPFGVQGEPDIRDINEADLRAVRPLAEGSFPTLAKLAQAVWPELPWRTDAPQNRAAAFLRDLEALSRAHGVWIRAPYPTACPVLEQGEWDGEFYQGRVTDDGLGVVFDRQFGDPAPEPADQCTQRRPNP